MSKSVLIIDDHRLITDCVPRLLQNQFQIVVANSSSEALNQLASTKFDAIILDLDLQEGVQCIDLLEAALANTPAVLVFFDDLTESDFRISHRRGVRAFVGKHEPATRLRDGLSEIIAGRQFLPTELLEKAIDSANACMPSMTPRIWYVLDALCRDPIKDNNTMSAELGLSVGRLKNILTELYRLFGVKTRHELPVEAARRGFTPGDPQAQRFMKAPTRFGPSKVVPKCPQIKPTRPQHSRSGSSQPTQVAYKKSLTLPDELTFAN